MTATVLRSDPSKIPTTLKEAVVDSLVNLTYAQVSGEGPTGQYLFGARPRTLLNSGFILPQKQATGDDEVTSPIWISSHGMQLQIAAGVAQVISVRPKIALYVRVIPRQDDLRLPNCRASFTLRRHVANELKAERTKRLDAEWEKVEGVYKSRSKHPGWPAIRERIVEEVYAARGIPRRLITTVDAEEPMEHSDESGDDVPDQVVAAPPTEPVTINDADFEPLAVPHKWMRLDVSLPDLTLDMGKNPDGLLTDVATHAKQMNDVIAARLTAWAESNDPETGGKLWGYRTKLEVPASQYRKWSDFLELARKSTANFALPKIRLAWDLQIAQDWLDSAKRNLFMALENKSESPRMHVDETEDAVFLVAIQAEVPKKLHRSLRLERIDPSYRFNRYLTYPAMGHNGGVKVLEASSGNLLLETTWAPRYVQPRIVPTAATGVERGVRALSQSNGLDGLLPIVPAMQCWLEKLPSRINPSDGLDTGDVEGFAREEEAFKDDLNKWGAEMRAVEAGLNVLVESRQAWKSRGAQSDHKAAVYEAWLGMNEAMADFMKLRFGTDDNKWRLFQLAFIIANIPALASRMTVPEFKLCYQEGRDDSVTLLYFATGGGKSEAFFGLLVFNLLLDRLRGKHTGVTALLRYPLRLLTIQQAQRCARVLAQAELIRRKHGYGGSPLSIGFWVGSGGSPNNHRAKGVSSIPDIISAPPHPKNEEDLCDKDQKYSAALRAWRKISKCPFCNSATALRRFVDDGDQTLGHVCTDIKCPSNGGMWKPLPFYIVDEDIYDLAPSVLLGTVDKLALIGHSARTIRRIYGMFGAAPWRNPRNGRLYVPENRDLKGGPAAKSMEGLFPAYKTGTKYFLDPFPSLIIQDEAHLLDESLGTFAGLFESTLDAVFAHLSESMGGLVATDPMGKRRRAKIIAASATVSEPERQLEHLYQRSIPATQFPHPGPTLYESFYAEPQKAADDEPERQKLADIEISSRQARIYCAFMTNGKPHTATSVAILSGFHLTITRIFDALISSDVTRTVEAKKLLAEHISAGQLRELHRNALLGASTSDIATVVDLHRIALTYVTNKKGGDQIMAAEAEETRKRHLNAEIELGGLDTRLITGSVEQGEIQAVVDAAQKRVEPGEPFPPLSNGLRSVIATSAISHGVDVDEFNSMFFAGMPSDIAEYIQASSRVGRMHIGFVVLVPTPQRRRDRHIIQVFDIFHRFLERMVQPAAIDRWAEKAVARVFPSLFQAYLAGVVPSRRLIELDDDKKDQTPDFSFIPNVRSELSKRGDAFIKEINAFIELAVGLRGGFAPEGEEHYRQKIDERTRSLLNTWASPVWGSGPMSGYFEAQSDPMKKPMTSLRDVDQGGNIVMSVRDVEGHRQKPEEVLRVMDLVRHGVADNEGTGD